MENKDLPQVENRSLGQELMERIMADAVEEPSTEINTIVITAPYVTAGAISNHDTATTAPEDSSKVMYTLVIINDILGWALVDSRATKIFTATKFISKQKLPVNNTQGAIYSGMGNKMTGRTGKAEVMVINGDIKCLRRLNYWKWSLDVTW